MVRVGKEILKPFYQIPIFFTSCLCNPGLQSINGCSNISQSMEFHFWARALSVQFSHIGVFEWCTFIDLPPFLCSKAPAASLHLFRWGNPLSCSLQPSLCFLLLPFPSALLVLLAKFLPPLREGYTYGLPSSVVWIM